MKIKDIEVFLLSDQLDEAFYFSQFSYSSRLICIVKVTTESGLVGWGEGYGPANIIKRNRIFKTFGGWKISIG